MGGARRGGGCHRRCLCYHPCLYAPLAAPGLAPEPRSSVAALSQGCPLCQTPWQKGRVLPARSQAGFSPWQSSIPHPPSAPVRAPTLDGCPRWSSEPILTPHRESPSRSGGGHRASSPSGWSMKGVSSLGKRFGGKALHWGVAGWVGLRGPASGCIALCRGAALHCVGLGWVVVRCVALRCVKLWCGA